MKPINSKRKLGRRNTAGAHGRDKFHERKRERQADRQTAATSQGKVRGERERERLDESRSYWT